MHLIFLLALPSTILAVSTTIVTVTAPAAPASTSFTDDTTFQNDMLEAHNFYRMEHGVGNLTWNETCASSGAKWSSRCEFVHSGGPTGENLAAGYPNATASVDAWGIERLQYDFSKPSGFTEATGHFTQLVWSNTSSVGCGRMSCEGLHDTPGYYIVCEYYPQGNVVGNDNQYFKDNVLKQKEGKGSDTVESGVTSSAGCGRNIRCLDNLWNIWGAGMLVGAVLVIGEGFGS